MKNVAQQANNLKKEMSGTEKLLNFNDALKSTVKLGAMFGILRKGFNIVKDITMSSVDMIETTHLFETAMGKVVDEYGNLDEAQSQYYIKAMAFQDKMNEKLGTNKKELMEFQAKFNSLYANQGVDKGTSEWLSEQLTKAGYDIASLRNQNVSEVMNKLYSGITGQTKSIRDLGVDIGEGSLTATLQNLGIDRTVNQLSYAEKEIVRYLTIVQQARSAQGDFARTFEQPANQIRVLKNQLAELGQVAGSFFVGIFGKIMPYVNGIIMAVKEVLKALASLFGFDLDLGSSGGSTLSSGIGSVADSAGTAGDNLGKATKQAKEFKKQLMGFDEINNIEPPTESASGGSGDSGGGVGGAVDPALLNALKDWDNMMDSIRGKAQEIRDKILDWLGVTDGSFRNLKKIWEVVEAIGKGFLAWKISSKILDFLQKIGLFKNLNSFQMAFGIGISIAGITAMWNGTQRLLDGDIDIFSLLETFLGMGAGTFGIVNILRSIKDGNGSAIIPLGDSFKIGFGIMLVIQGFQILKEGIEKGDIVTAILGALELGSGLYIGVKTILGIEGVTEGISKIAQAVAPIAKIVGGIAMVIGGVWTAITNFIDMLKEGFSWVKEFFMVIGIAIAAVGAIILGVPALIAGVVAAIVAVVATIIVVIREHWDSIVSFFTETIPQAWNDFTSWLGQICQNIWDTLVNAWNSIVSFFTQTIPSWIQNVIDWFEQLPYNLGLLVGTMIGHIVKFGQDCWNWVTNELPKIIQSVIDWFAQLPRKNLELAM